MGLSIGTKKLVQDGVDAQTSFNKGNIYGSVVCKPWVEMGRLPEPYRSQLKQQLEHDMVRFMIHSYNTPIAWVLSGGTWIVPEVTYSKSTTHHQSVVKTAIGTYDFYNKF